MMTLEPKNHGTHTDLTDPSTSIANWIQATTDFHEKFGLLMKSIEVLEQQQNPVFSANCKLQLSNLSRIATESVQILKQLVADMDSQHTFYQDSPQASIDRLFVHTLRLKRQTEQIDQMLRLTKFQPIPTYASSKIARA